MGARAMIVLSVLASGLSLAGCASLEGSAERGGVIRYSQLQPDTGMTDALTMADAYCGRFGRAAHIAGEHLGWLWSDTVTFDCVE